MPEPLGSRHFAAVLFDLDGTLIQTGGLYERRWRAWAAERGVDPEIVVGLHPGRPAAETIRLVAPGLDAVVEAARFNADLAADPDATGVAAYEGARRILLGLPDRSWAIATSAPRMMVERWLRSVDLPVPEALVTADDIVHGKPAPEPYLRAAALLGQPADRCLAVEDAPAGIASARAAGAAVLGILSTHEPADLAGADAIVERLADVELMAHPRGIVVRRPPLL
jgi:sugar-phosphatase